MISDQFELIKKEFLKNAPIFEKNGLGLNETQELLSDYLKLLKSSPELPVLKVFQNESSLEENGVYTPRVPEFGEFMLKFLKPVLRNFKLEGLENFTNIIPLINKYPLVVISNHTSHLDTIVIYYLLATASLETKKLADSLVVIASRLALETLFIRLGTLSVDTLLICSHRDMEKYPEMNKLMNKINIRSFRYAQELQKKFRTIAIYPEGTRSRTGQLARFIDSSYHFMANKIVIPISLEGVGSLLPTDSLVFNDAHGKVSISKPIFCGSWEDSPMKSLNLPSNIDTIKVPNNIENTRRFWIDEMAKRVAQNLPPDLQGYYKL